ncbi:MAG: restriction endonuclease PLD domain-containing protein [Dehalococcoidia bacterium]
MSIVLQSHVRPTEILSALTSLSDNRTTEIRIAVAYVTRSGCDLLFPRMQDSIGRSRWPHVPKTVITSFDFGHTEPEALEYLQAIPGCTVRIANIGRRPSFHPKIYIFCKRARRASLIGSPNLSQSALTDNTEIAEMQTLVPDEEVLDGYWNEVARWSTPLTRSVLQAYARRRRRDPPPNPEAPVPVRMPSSEPVPFGNAVASGQLNPEDYAVLWVQAGSMSSGGSHNQLELPRRASRFFGLPFEDYGGQIEVIGSPKLGTSRRIWPDRRLTWHGHNGMERINLPTIAKGGFRYRNTAVIFRRTSDRFLLDVALWNSPVAQSWRNASIQLGHLFRLGAPASARWCGLF